MDTSGRPLGLGFGVDLGAADGRPDEQIAQMVAEAIDPHHVVRIRSLDWDEPRQLELTARIGTVVGERSRGADRPNVRHERGADRYADRWHADLSWSTTDAVSVLCCTQIGPDPDPTYFLDTSVALAGMDRELVQRLSGRTVLHDLRHSRRLRPAGETRSLAARSARRLAHRIPSLPPSRTVEREMSPAGVAHELCVPRQQGRDGTPRPLIDRCERTGTRFLRIGDHAWQVSGLDRDDSANLLDELHRAIERGPFIWQQDWRVGDMVVYDNRMVLHRRGGTAGTAPGRVLRRTLAEWRGAI